MMSACSNVPGENRMTLGPLLPEVNILCVKLQDSRPPQASFLKNGTFLFQEYAFSLQEHYPHFKILKCELWFSPSFQIFCYPALLIRKVRKNHPPLCKGDEGMIEGVRGTSIGVWSWKGGTICL